MGGGEFGWNLEVNSLTVCLSHIIKASLKMLAERYF
jgi:hypothetical protein